MRHDLVSNCILIIFLRQICQSERILKDNRILPVSTTWGNMRLIDAWLLALSNEAWYPLVNVCIAMENHHVSLVNQPNMGHVLSLCNKLPEGNQLGKQELIMGISRNSIEESKYRVESKDPLNV